MVAPVFVTVDPANTANVAAVPSGTPGPVIAFCAHDNSTIGVAVGIGVGVGGGVANGMLVGVTPGAGDAPEV
jgi:hypothetical protein